MSRAVIGHNGPPAFESGEDFPEDMPKMHYFKCDIQALRKAIFDKPLDIRGAYISVLLAMYEFMEPLPADDNIARMRCGIWDMRVYRRIKRDLIAMKLIAEKPSGAITNGRFEEEIAAYVTEFKNRKLGGLYAVQSRPSKPVVAVATHVARPELGDSYGVANPVAKAVAKPELDPHLSEKTNEINGGPDIRARDLELEIERELKKKKEREAPATQIAPPPEALDEKKVRRRKKLTEDWLLPKALGEWALANFHVSEAEVRHEAKRFKDHWLASGEQKLDWAATWRKWCRSPYLKWREREGRATEIVDGDLLAPVETVVVDPWAEQRAEAARRRAEEDGA
jgi:hypothetical protein